ncbi:DNA methyltransferase [Catenulispora pinisilvae]|uniref:DNA methyltransferase n=1 Tax=Catenulispora pinisilvae TaxID=2705253 RepID=UPI0018919F9C|nr:DNA methyltransferase [Catenulispora pinisilvae]
MAEFKAIDNRGEYLSDHYLAELMAKDLGGVRARWKTAQLAQQPNSAQGLRTLSRVFNKASSDITEGLTGDDVVQGDPRTELVANLRRRTLQRDFADAVLKALAFPAESTDAHIVTRRKPLTVQHLGTQRTVETALTISNSSSLELVALDATWAANVDDAIDSHSGSLLLEPIQLDGSNQVTLAADAINFLFGVEDGPRYVLLLAGGVIVLADSSVWYDGRYLALDLGTAIGLNDTSVGGELETAAALFGAESLLTHDGSTALSELVDKGRKHAVGVSKELREGLRVSVELIAQEIVDRINAIPGADPAELGADLPKRLTKQALRYLYRILFLLYAESRPELGILPVNDDSYQNGYGLARLGELVSYDLPEESAEGLHYFESLALLFDLIERGHNPLTPSERAALEDGELGGADDDHGIRFEPLRSDLFKKDATSLIGKSVRVGAVVVDTRLRNGVLHRVLEKLMLTSSDARGAKARGGRGYVSYAQLGINQLGAVYEGLMSYTGFFAAEDLYEVAKDGDPSHGTWMLPIDEAGEYDDGVFVTEDDAVTGEKRRKIHKKGSFVYRLSGRERQRSASYYTPEILTEFTVRHALAELIGEDGSGTNPPKMTARQILDLTVCEPALGSGAFLNEAIRQLAVAYLNRTRLEMATRAEPQEYPVGPDYETALQRIKAYIALHNSYGVDLNETAVELAEVSLWLNSMHEGLQAPWFGLHLRRGNSLIGARRAVYDKALLKGRAWLSTPPADRPLREDAEDHEVGPNEIHHFLLPAHGWGAVAETAQAKELATGDLGALVSWRSEISKVPSASNTKRLLALSTRVEQLWALTKKRLEASENEVRRTIDVWGLDTDAASLPTSSGAVTREQVEKALNDPESPLQRLELVMNAWCALWFWPVGQPNTPTPPTIEEWLAFLEAVLGLPAPKEKARGGKYGNALAAAGDTLGLFAPGDSFEALAEEDANDRIMSRSVDMLDVAFQFPWLGIAGEISDREGFFHWEVRFAQIFAKGGFDLQVGNPPWARPRWNDHLALAEIEPYFGLEDNIPPRVFEERRSKIFMEFPEWRKTYLSERSSAAGFTEFLRSRVMYGTLLGIQVNFYMNFMERSWRSIAPSGSIGLIHQDSHFSDPKAGHLRAATYERLRRTFFFRNTMKVFPEIRDATDFGIHIYGDKQLIKFLGINWLYHPGTADLSLDHDGVGEAPALQLPWGGWDTRPHKDRLIFVTEESLRVWAALVDKPGTKAREARMMRPITNTDNDALRIVSQFPVRLSDYTFTWSRGLEEDKAKEKGLIEWRSATPLAWNECVLQGPHFGVSTPFAKLPFEVVRSNNDWTSRDLTTLSTDDIPRTNYQRLAGRDAFEAAQVKREDGIFLPSRWRVSWRNMTKAKNERTLISSLLLPGPTHVNAVHAMALDDNRKTVTVAGLWSALPLDYLLKVAGTSKVNVELARHLPAPILHPLTRPLLLRTLRLNCLTRDYAQIWEEIYDEAWLSDRWTASQSKTTVALEAIAPEWGMKTPLRTDYDRRMALVEIDALVALMLGLSTEQLCAMFRSQFGTLRKYEYLSFFHPDGHQIGSEADNAGARQTDVETLIVRAWKKAKLDPEAEDIEPPADWIKPDREAEMTRAYEEFARRLAAGEYPEIPEDDEHVQVEGTK